jgi:hypothetical protein
MRILLTFSLTCTLTPAPDIGLSLSALETQLYRSASDRQAGIDVFGWSPGMLLSTRRFSGDLTPLKAFARLLHILGSSHVPEAVAFLLTPGACTALNKIPEEENRMRKSQNLQPKIRPINNGSLFLKNVFRACNNSTSGKQAKRSCEPVQFGTGAKGGPTTMGLAASAAYKARKVIHTDDAQNAFNALRRSALLASTKEVWPEISPICNKYYGIKSPVFYTYFKDGLQILRVIWSTEGTRMGCAYASTGFCLTMHDKVYSKLSDDFPDVAQMAATDDLVKLWEPPPSNDSGL